ncbi:MAG: hypothetical protein R3D32_10300 [Nitratireductor sp.]
MQLIVGLAVLISGAAYLGYVPDGMMIVDLPLPLVAGLVISLGMIYAMANFGSRKR